MTSPSRSRFVASLRRSLTPLVSAAFVASAAAQDLPGLKPDGSTLLPNGWSVRPHGRQLPLTSDLPIRTAWHPDGTVLAVQHAGYRTHEVVLFDAVRERELGRVPLARTWSGMAWSPRGDRLYVSGGADDVVRAFSWDLASRSVGAETAIPVGDPARLDLPAGLAVDGAGRLFVPLQRADRVLRLDATGVTELAIELPAGSHPFECLVHAGRVFVSCWGTARVMVFDADSGGEAAAIATGAHPGELCLDAQRGRLFVGNANENSVSVIDLASLQVTETLNSALYPAAPPGSTPNALALAPNGNVLLVANADNNNLAVVDVTEPGQSRSLGFIPVGAYPTSVRWHASGKVIVANGKGSGGSQPNPGGPQPGDHHPQNLAEYTGAMFTGSLSVFEFPEPSALQALSEHAYRCSPLRGGNAVRSDRERPADSPIPAQLGQGSPIRHCIYIVKENRTYDQVLGDDPRGNGDPALCLFPAVVTPNHHALAREFVLLDNFYVESEVSADGHEWTLGAYATDFVERSWPVAYGGKGKAPLAGGGTADIGYPSEGRHEIAFPERRYLWDSAKRAGIDFRSYGEFVVNGATADAPGAAAYATLVDHFDPQFRSFDLNYRDVDRAARFLVELAEFERRGTMPQLIVLRLPNDHTAGTVRGQRTPRAFVADNDLALGTVVEALSKSSFWPSLAIFVVEDDAQNGPDHVDAHRSIAFVIGPWVRRAAIVSTMYSTCSMLRTMELVLGLEPMSQFDAAARPMYDVFAGEPDLRPFACLPATWSLDERNARTAYGADRAEDMELAREDAADDLELNELIWKSIRGADSPVPAPRRAAFVRVAARD